MAHVSSRGEDDVRTLVGAPVVSREGAPRDRRDDVGPSDHGATERMRPIQLRSEAVFGTHPLGRPVIGRADVVSTVSGRSLAVSHRRACQGSNVVLAAAGNVRGDELASLLSARLNGGAAGPGLAVRKPARANGTPAFAFSRRTPPSSTTSASAHRGSPAPTSGGSRGLGASTRSSEAPPRPGSSRNPGERGMAYSVYSHASEYTEDGPVGFYVGTRAENLAACLEMPSWSSPIIPPATSVQTSSHGPRRT